MKYGHSPKDGKPAQSYEDHINGVSYRAEGYAQAVAKYCSKDKTVFCGTVKNAANYHDLGKLDTKNQEVLSGKKKAKKLPINHTDAGAAHFMKNENLCPHAAAVIQAHHQGFIDFVHESTKKDRFFRDELLFGITNNNLVDFERIHNELIKKDDEQFTVEVQGDETVLLRMILSCLVDADHTDTATYYGKYPEESEAPPLYPEKRLKKLDTFMEELRKNGEASLRNDLRNQMYDACKKAEVYGDISSCDSPVGSGKTTAIMAHLLTQAKKRGLRRIFVVLPFTSIISQSVKIYRKALTLPGEKPEDVVAELHHRAEFKNLDARHFTALWRAPIIVTTAVAFFETLAANTTSTLRRLHELPGSAIFVDESHAALPTHLLPLAWRWMNSYAEDWGCYWVLASGSLNRFWEIEEIAYNTGKADVPEIVDDTLRNNLSYYEERRITYKFRVQPQSLNELTQWIAAVPGPRLVILNTVQSAAVLALNFKDKFGRASVEHLSTALTAEDREGTLAIIQKRLKNKKDNDWTLIATSCVEAGMDLSFTNGFRELGSLSSLLQAAGRVNREGKLDTSEMWVFSIKEEEKLKINPGMQNSSRVLKSYFEKNVSIHPELTTQAIKDELALYGTNGEDHNIIELEQDKCFPGVEKAFKIIDTDTRIAVVDEKTAEEIRQGSMDWQALQRNSVQIVKYKLDEFRAEEIAKGIYYWKYGYNEFIGYMEGVVSTITSKDEVIIL